MCVCVCVCVCACECVCERVRVWVHASVCESIGSISLLIIFCITEYVTNKTFNRFNHRK